MGKRELKFFLSCALCLSLSVACDMDVFKATGEDERSDDNGNAGDIEVIDSEKFTITVPDALAENITDHDNPGDYVWNRIEMVNITLNENTIAVDGAGATVDGNKVTISSAGTYSLSGSLADGQIIVDSEDEEIVRLVLNNVNIKSSANSPIYIASAEKAVIVLADNSENFVTDGKSYVFEDVDEEEPNAAVFSKADLTIHGNGVLTVMGNYNDGIASKDGLIIKSGTIIVNSADDGIRGKDYLLVKNGNIAINSGGDGLKSDNAEDSARGYIVIESGEIDITAGGDAIEAETDVLIADGILNLNTGGGSSRRVVGTASAKGIKGIVNTIIDEGTLTISSADDAVHSNQSLVINGGVYNLSSGDDAIHADSTLGINGGTISIAECFEGIESAMLQINDGDIHIASSDDGLNGAGGRDGSGMDQRFGRPDPGGFRPSGNYYLNINGGYIAINATGDGIDINGSIVMTGGIVLVDGPTQNMNSALDYDVLFKMTGGFLLATGSSGMAQAPGASSTQYSLLINFTSSKTAGSLVHLQTSEGKELFTYAPQKKYQSIAFSSPDLKKGTSYDLYHGGSSTGELEDDLYQNGTYTPGSKVASFTISDIVTKINSR